MIRHFFGVFFWSFISVVVFVNLFQFSGAPMPLTPWDSFGYDFPDVTFENSYFGFSSIFNFLYDLSNQTQLNWSLEVLNNGFGVLRMFNFDTLISQFTIITSYDYASNGAYAIIAILRSLYALFTALVVGGLTQVAGIFLIILGVLVFLWNIISLFLRFLLGYYNVVLPSIEESLTSVAEVARIYCAIVVH